MNRIKSTEDGYGMVYIEHSSKGSELPNHLGLQVPSLDLNTLREVSEIPTTADASTLVDHFLVFIIFQGVPTVAFPLFIQSPVGGPWVPWMWGTYPLSPSAPLS